MDIRCPKCRCVLTPTGELDVDGVTLPVYQCDSCTVPWSFDGDTFHAALTFALDADGRYLDATTLEVIPQPSVN